MRNLQQEKNDGWKKNQAPGQIQSNHQKKTKTQFTMGSFTFGRKAPWGSRPFTGEKGFGLRQMH